MQSKRKSVNKSQLNLEESDSSLFEDPGRQVEETKQAAKRGKTPTKKTENKKSDNKKQKSAAEEESKSKSVKKQSGKDENDKTGDHPPPKKPLGAYAFFNQERSKVYYAAGKGKEVFGRVSEDWQKMETKDKQKYIKMNENDKKRFDKQVAELKKHGYYTLEDGSKSTDPQNAALLKVKVKKGKKDKGKDDSESDEDDSHPPPKKAISAWGFFNAEMAKKFAAEGKQKEAFQLASELWNKMTDAEKKPYNDKNAKDKTRVERQTAELKKHGYYLLDDGSKSTDEQNSALMKVKKKKTKKNSKQSAKSNDEEESKVKETKKGGKKAATNFQVKVTHCGG